MRRLTLRDLLLGIQIALCALLLTASLVALRGMDRSLHAPMGFVPQGTMVADTDMQMAGYSDDSALPVQRRMIEAGLAAPRRSSRRHHRFIAPGRRRQQLVGLSRGNDRSALFQQRDDSAQLRHLAGVSQSCRNHPAGGPRLHLGRLAQNARMLRSSMSSSPEKCLAMLSRPSADISSAAIRAAIRSSESSRTASTKC